MSKSQPTMVAWVWDRQLLQRISVVAVVEELGTDLLRYRMPEHMLPFRVPFAVSRLPVVPVLANASIALLLIHFEWQPVALHYAEAHRRSASVSGFAESDSGCS